MPDIVFDIGTDEAFPDEAYDGPFFPANAEIRSTSGGGPMSGGVPMYDTPKKIKANRNDKEGTLIATRNHDGTYKIEHSTLRVFNTYCMWLSFGTAVPFFFVNPLISIAQIAAGLVNAKVRVNKEIIDPRVDFQTAQNLIDSFDRGEFGLAALKSKKGLKMLLEQAQTTARLTAPEEIIDIPASVTDITESEYIAGMKILEAELEGLDISGTFDALVKQHEEEAIALQEKKAPAHTTPKRSIGRGSGPG